jgi:hypothetical protein
MSEAESVALAYLRAADNDRWAALVRLAQDALADLDRAEVVVRARGQLISLGYIRAGSGH